jgi:hypothetical protein
MSLYTISPMTITIAGASFTFPHVQPGSSGGSIDIIRDFRWKNNKTSGRSISEVPSIMLTEYTLGYGKWQTKLSNLFNNIINNTTGSTDPYGQLYSGLATKFVYKLPYLLKDGSTLKGKTDNTWSEFKLEDIPLIGDTLSKASKLGEKIITGFGFENTGNYSETKKRSVVIEFPLYNTMDIGDTIKNYEFISLFGMQNLKIRTSFLTYIPPKIYSVESTGRGGVYMPAAYVSSYDVRSIGATREIQIGGNTHLIPEAYKVSITLTELIQESANIMQGSLGGSKTQLIGNYKGTMESIAKGPTEQVSEALNTEVIKTAFKAANTAVAGGFNAITKLF